MLFGIAKTHLYRPLRQRVDIFEGSEPETTASVPWGLEKLDGVAGRVLEQDLLSASALDDLVAEVRPSIAHSLDFAGEIIDLELDAVPAARLGLTSVGHGLACSARAGLVQQKAQVVSREDRETGGVKLDTEAEPLDVERDRCFDVVDYVTHADRGHRFNPPRTFLAGFPCIKSTSIHVFTTTRFIVASGTAPTSLPP